MNSSPSACFSGLLKSTKHTSNLGSRWRRARLINVCAAQRFGDLKEIITLVKKTVKGELKTPNNSEAPLFTRNQRAGLVGNPYFFERSKMSFIPNEVWVRSVLCVRECDSNAGCVG